MPISTPDKIITPWATSGLKDTIPETADPINGRAGFDQGFPAINLTPRSAGGIPPFGQDFNGIFFDITQAIQFQQSGGSFPYDSTWATAVGGYPIGAIVSRTDNQGFWRNTSANNLTDPEAGGAGWQPEGSGSTAVTMTSSNVTLTSLEASRNIIIITGTITTNLNLILPTYVKSWTIVNNTTGSFTITTKTASGSGVIAVQGIANIVYGDGTNIKYSVSPLLADGSVTSSKLASSSQGFALINGKLVVDANVTTANALTASIKTNAGATPSASDPVLAIVRNPTITDSGYVMLSITSALTLTVSSGSTLGTANSTLSNIVWLLINNAGVAELAVNNIAGGVVLDGTGLISTTAEGGAGGADSATVVYSSSARSNVSYVPIVITEITEATAGTWVTAPSKNYPIRGGQLFSSLGYGQTYQNVIGSRALSTIYTNTTGKPIFVSFTGGATSAATTFNALVNGLPAGTAINTNTVTITACLFFVVPAGQTYQISITSGTGSIAAWNELR